MAYISQHSGEEIDQSIVDVNNLNTKIDTKVDKSGDTMTGSLTVPRIQIAPETDNYIRIVNKNTDGTTRGGITQSPNHNYAFLEYATDTNYYTNFYLPNPDTGLTANNSYPILTKKNFLNMIYPVGSVYVTSTNTNPSSTLGGTWTLTDKEFGYASFAVADIFTVNSTNLTSIKGTIIRNNHFFTVYFTLTPKVAITDTTLQMGTFSLSNLGVSALPSQAYSSMTDGGNSVFTFSINGSGVLSTTDVMVRGSSTASLATSYTPVGYCIIPVTTSQMLDSACSRFFWKRTA